MRLRWFRLTHSRAALWRAICFALTLAGFNSVSNAAPVEKVLHSFCSRGGLCPDGSFPNAGLVMDGAGNLYGTTEMGGGSGSGGTIFRLSPDATKTVWKFSALYRFCSRASCLDGGSPRGLAIDSSGNLYGVTNEGGKYGGGVIFQLYYDPAANKWKERVLYNFCQLREFIKCLDGVHPNRLYLNSSGAIFGVTISGGKYDKGIAYKLTPDATHTVWQMKVLYNFGATPTGSISPTGVLVRGPGGAFYGTASFGGSGTGQGTVFELGVDKATGKWGERVLYSFCSFADCHDGAYPGSLLLGGGGALYGTTSFGGDSNGNGVAFKLTPNADRTIWTETVIHTFCSEPDCADGSAPGALFKFPGVKGKIFGLAAEWDSAPRHGLIYTLSPPNANHPTWTQKVFKRFCMEGGTCPTGSGPLGNLQMDADGRIFGMTYYGGYDSGVIYELLP